jgi:hypothetical protein
MGFQLVITNEVRDLLFVRTVVLSGEIASTTNHNLGACSSSFRYLRTVIRKYSQFALTGHCSHFGFARLQIS